VIFDGWVASVYRVGFAQFFQVTTTELAPADQAGLEFSQQLFARAEVRHPDMISRRGHAATTKPGYQDAQAVLARFNGGEYRLGLDHKLPALPNPVKRRRDVPGQGIGPLKLRFALYEGMDDVPIHRRWLVGTFDHVVLV